MRRVWERGLCVLLLHEGLLPLALVYHSCYTYSNNPIDWGSIAFVLRNVHGGQWPGRIQGAKLSFILCRNPTNPDGVRSNAVVLTSTDGGLIAIEHRHPAVSRLTPLVVSWARLQLPGYWRLKSWLGRPSVFLAAIYTALPHGSNRVFTTPPPSPIDGCLDHMSTAVANKGITSTYIVWCVTAWF